jgi:hypothetical protein
MAVIECPGCGLPREDDQIGVVPCPICATAASAAPRQIIHPSTDRSVADIPVGVPADAGELKAQTAQPSGRRLSSAATIGAFFLGVMAGVGGLLAWQWVHRHEEIALAPRSSNDEVVSATSLVKRPIAVAPNPRARTELVPASARAEPISSLKGKDVQKLPGETPATVKRVVVPLNQPNASYTLPGPVNRGEHLILRGKVRMLRVNGLEPGAILDASELEAGSIYICGTIDGGSILRISCPDGVVEVPAAVRGRSRLDIHAPGSSVRFPHPTTSEQAGSRIDGGSTVVITGRTVELRGDVDGAGTSVKVVLTRNGSLKIAAVRGAAAVEYRTENPLAADPPASAAVVEPTATFKKSAGR